MTTPKHPKHPIPHTRTTRGFVWVEMTPDTTENTTMPATTAPSCPDGGTCHHQCAGRCFRVATCEPLSGVFPGDTWPEGIHAQHTQDATGAAAEPAPEQPAVTVASVEAHLRERNNGQLPECPVCEQAPVLVREAELPSDEPTGHTTMLLGKPIHVRRAVIVACSNEENCAGIGIEITGPPEPTTLAEVIEPAPRHRAPIGMSAVTPCCDKSPLELPGHDTITVDNSRVTCAPTPTIVYHWTSRMLPPKPIDPKAEFNPDDYAPRPDPDDSYDCALRDIHDDGESTGIGWQDPVDPVSDRERWEFVPYYVVSYPTAGQNTGVATKPLRVCEDCATYLSGIAPYLLPEADTAKLTDRFAFDYPTADALDALYYLANAEHPATHEPLGLDHLTAADRPALGSQVLAEVCAPLIVSRAVLLDRLPHLDPAEFDRLVQRVNTEATSVIRNGAHGHDLIRALDTLNVFLTLGTTGVTGSPRTQDL